MRRKQIILNISNYAEAFMAAVAAAAFALLISIAPVAFADDDTSANAPIGFSAIASKAKGVILRVPVNANGDENTDAALMRFHSGERTLVNASNVANAWNQSKAVLEDDVLLGRNGPAVNPDTDSSTWGWYNWRWYGWQNPYYYSWYRPTFYYYNNWYSYPYYYYWNYGNYRYYYYWY